MRIIAVINQKGGVGKTTTTVNLGAALARAGRKVLLLDLDPQANLTLHVDRQPTSESETMTYLLIDDQPIAPLIRPTETEGLYVVPADSSLGGVERVLADRIGRETILREALNAYGTDEVAFDYVLMDCPPSLGVLSANALVAAGEVLIPMKGEYFSLQGMAKLTEVIQLVRDRLNPDLKIAKVLPCMFDSRTRLATEVLDEIYRHFGNMVSEHPIRMNVKLAEAPSFGRTIFDHDPDSNGAADYSGVAAEILAMEEGPTASVASQTGEAEELAEGNAEGSAGGPAAVDPIPTPFQPVSESDGGLPPADPGPSSADLDSHPERELDA